MGTRDGWVGYTVARYISVCCVCISLLNVTRQTAKNTRPDTAACGCARKEEGERKIICLDAMADIDVASSI